MCPPPRRPDPGPTPLLPPPPRRGAAPCAPKPDLDGGCGVLQRRSRGRGARGARRCRGPRGGASPERPRPARTNPECGAARACQGVCACERRPRPRPAPPHLRAPPPPRALPARGGVCCSRRRSRERAAAEEDAGFAGGRCSLGSCLCSGSAGSVLGGPRRRGAEPQSRRPLQPPGPVRGLAPPPPAAPRRPPPAAAPPGAGAGAGPGPRGRRARCGAAAAPPELKDALRSLAFHGDLRAGLAPADTSPPTFSTSQGVCLCRELGPGPAPRRPVLNPGRRPEERPRALGGDGPTRFQPLARSGQAVTRRQVLRLKAYLHFI
ncbi:uncharacterized protein [Vulpes vulpes]|uniref:Basic proline-rich protein-like n=1 Tax=Vulpes vulpes TaxID=9627 RepID=A0ABM4ZH13_VULVU